MSGNNTYCPYCENYHHTIEHDDCRARVLAAAPKLERCRCGGGARLFMQEREPHIVYPDGRVLHDRVIKCGSCENSLLCNLSYYDPAHAVSSLIERWNE